jgi:hypothetical protein
VSGKLERAAKSDSRTCVALHLHRRLKEFLHVLFSIVQDALVGSMAKTTGISYVFVNTPLWWGYRNFRLRYLLKIGVGHGDSSWTWILD